VLAIDEVDAAEAELAIREAERAQADAAVRLASAQRRRHQILAPFPGTVAARMVDVGDWVAPGTPMLQLVRVDGLEVVVDAPAELARAVAPGDAVRLGGATGRVAGVVPALDRATRTARLRVVPDELGTLVPGGTVDVTFAVQRSGGLVVPRDAVVESADELRVFRVVEGTAQPLQVQPLASAADELLVEADGLSVGDVLVVRGNERLRPDQPVTVVE
jgi:RND family efflux transporter MFP subunit